MNDIDDFEELYVKISEIEIHGSGESGIYHTYTLDPEVDLDKDGEPWSRPNTIKRAKCLVDRGWQYITILPFLNS